MQIRPKMINTQLKCDPKPIEDDRKQDANHKEDKATFGM